MKNSAIKILILILVIYFEIFSFYFKVVTDIILFLCNNISVNEAFIKIHFNILLKYVIISIKSKTIFNIKKIKKKNKSANSTLH